MASNAYNAPYRRKQRHAVSTLGIYALRHIMPYSAHRGSGIPRAPAYQTRLCRAAPYLKRAYNASHSCASAHASHRGAVRASHLRRRALPSSPSNASMSSAHYRTTHAAARCVTLPLSTGGMRAAQQSASRRSGALAFTQTHRAARLARHLRAASARAAKTSLGNITATLSLRNDARTLCINLPARGIC